MLTVVDDPRIKENARIFENPFDRVYHRWTMYALIILLLVGLAITLVVGKLGYLIASVMVVLLGYAVDWYAHDYSQPSRVLVSPKGLVLYFRRKKPIMMYWANVRGIFRRPESDALCKAGIRYYHGRPSEVTLEIADAIENGYNSVMNVPLKAWDGRRQWGD